MGGSNGAATNGLVVVSSVVVVLRVTGAGSEPQPDSRVAPVIIAKASPWLKYDLVVMICSVWFELRNVRCLTRCRG